jgi:hypothetical protein
MNFEQMEDFKLKSSAAAFVPREQPVSSPQTSPVLVAMSTAHVQSQTASSPQYSLFAKGNFFLDSVQSV